MKSNFVHLHTHSHYSLLDGAVTVEALIEEAKRQGMPALAITDHGNLFGAIEFYQLARKQGLNAIIGYESYLAPASRFDKKGTKSATEPYSHLTLLVKNDTGYRNLIKLASIAYLEGFYRKPRIDKELLEKYKEGLIVLSGCLHSEMAQLALENKIDQAVQIAGYYKELFKDDYYLEVQQHNIPEQTLAIKGFQEISRRTGIPLVATNDVHYLKKQDSKAHDILLCIATNKRVADQDRMRMRGSEFYFKSGDEMSQAFAELPEAVANTLKVADKCNLFLNFGDFHLPHFDPPDNKSTREFVNELAEKGIRARYPKDSEAARHRLETELKIIEKNGLIDYFLVVWDFVRFAKENKISVGPGRGSSAGSILAYVLGITDIDPLKYDLLFERFLNVGRKEHPDIDIDFSQFGRETVINYVRDKYGRTNVSQIITFGTMKARAAIRDVGRVMNIPLFDVDRIAKKLSSIGTLAESLKADPELRQMIEEKKEIKEMFEISQKLEGLCRHASTHAAGLVIADKPLDNYVPLYFSNGIDTTQYPMEALQTIGLLKVDFLGLVTLDIIDRCLELIFNNRKIKLELDSLPLDDKKTYEMLSRGEAKGVFQLESAGMRDIAQKLKPDRIEDIIATIALFRPGPLQGGLVDNYIRCKHNPREITYVHPSLEALLKETNGIILYQEQVMRIANRIGGFTLEESDNLRKAMGKKIPEIMREYGEKFVSGAVKNKIPKATAEKIFEMMEYFGGYGFNKSHSTAYAMTSYRTAYLKANYPVEFLAAALVYNMSDTDKLLDYLEECRRLKIKVIPPDINVSFSDFTVKGDDIIFGLSAVKNVGAKAVSYIIDARNSGGPFSGIYDFCERVDLGRVDKLVIESLIKSGAMDNLPEHTKNGKVNRNQLLQNLEQVMYICSQHQTEKRAGQLNILQPADSKSGYRYPQLQEVPELNEEDLLSFEKESLGIYVSGHPLVKYEKLLKELSPVTIKQLLEKTPPIDNIKICGIISQVENIILKKQKGSRMVAFKLRDLTGTINAVVFSEELSKFKGLVSENKIVCLKGRLDSRKGESVIRVKEVASIEDAYMIMPNCVVIDISLTGLEENIINGLKDVFLAHPGNCPVFLKVRTTENEVAIVKLSSDYSVSVSPRFREDIGELVGSDSIGYRL